MPAQNVTKPVPVSLLVSRAGRSGLGRARVVVNVVARFPARSPRHVRTVLTVHPGAGGPPFNLEVAGPVQPGGAATLTGDAMLPPGSFRFDMFGALSGWAVQVPARESEPVRMECVHPGRQRSWFEGLAANSPRGALMAAVARMRSMPCCRARLTSFRSHQEGGLYLTYAVTRFRAVTFPNGRLIRILPGRYAVFGPDQAGARLSDRQAFPFGLSHLHLTGPMIRRHALALDLPAAADPFGFDPEPRPMTAPLSRALDHLWETMRDPYAQGYFQAVEAACDGLLFLLLRDHPSRAGNRHGRLRLRRMGPQLIDRNLWPALSYIHDRFSGPCPIPAVARHAGVSLTNLQRLFRRHLQVSPNDYLQAVRVEKARELLRDRSRSFAEVARAVGYQDPRNFRRVFKNHARRPIRTFRAW